MQLQDGATQFIKVFFSIFISLQLVSKIDLYTFSLIDYDEKDP